MNVIICGSRGFNNYDTLCNIINTYIYEKNINISDITILSGSARGADRLGERYAQEYNIQVKKFIPNWDQYGKKAGMIRNSLMVNEADLIFAFWDGESHGTSNTINTSIKKGIPLVIYNYNNKVLAFL